MGESRGMAWRRGGQAGKQRWSHPYALLVLLEKEASAVLLIVPFPIFPQLVQTKGLFLQRELVQLCHVPRDG